MTREALIRNSREFAIKSTHAEYAFSRIFNLEYTPTVSQVPPYYARLADGRRVDVIYIGEDDGRFVVLLEELHFELLPDLYAAVSGVDRLYKYHGMILASSVYDREMTRVGDEWGYVVEEGELAHWITNCGDVVQEA